ncbi:Bacterial ph-like domain, partial [Globisporangium splendens]
MTSMLKGIASDMTGSADICRPLRQLESAIGAGFLLPNEIIMFSLQSIKEEFTFTNHALLKIHGDSATTTRKLVERYDYKSHTIDHVEFETAGRADRDVEIKFKIGDHRISIDIARDEEATVRDYYKVITMLGRVQRKNERSWEFARLAIKSSSEALYLTEGSGQTLTRQSDDAYGWVEQAYERTHPRCYRDVIHNAFMELRTIDKVLP